MATSVSLPILPVDAWNPEVDEEVLAAGERDPFPPESRHTYEGPSGRWLLDAALGSLGISRSDEVAIVSTSDETYISTCVSVTAFNHGRISRIVTGDTSVVVIIHEFGYLHPDLEPSVARWRDRGIVVIEDCAHVLAAEIDGVPVGGLGDMAIYSFPKVVPTRSGGLLRSRSPVRLPSLTDDDADRTAAGRAAADPYLGRSWYLNQRRLERHRIMGSTGRVRELSEHAVPWGASLTVSSRNVVEPAVPGVEWIATLCGDRVIIPTNPLVETSRFEAIADQVVVADGDR